MDRVRPQTKQILSWCFFDFANSSYSAVIAAVIFPVFYVSKIVGNDSGQGDLWWGRAISASMAIVALTSPLLGGIADYSGRRKRLLFIYTTLCVLAVACFSILKPGMIMEGFLLIVLANIGMEGGLVFYNSFLTGIAPATMQGRVSAWGFGVGYAGSILSLLFALPLVKGGNFQATWLLVSGFFLLFSLPAFLYLPPDRKTGPGILDSSVKGIAYSWQAVREIWNRRPVRRFLLGFLIYEDGVNTVIVFSSIFAATTLRFNAMELIGLYIIVQITALVGAFAMARPIDTLGPKKVLSMSLLLWTGVAVAAYFIPDKLSYFVLASVAGTGLGTVQAAGRAFYARFIPEGRESEYFGLYSLVGKSSAVAGPLLFGYLSATFHSQRPAILSISIFFALGLLIIRGVDGGGPNDVGSQAPE
ncbi:MAG: MFS transporter [Thermodesulfovibrio sp.]|nr:MFS transporter [Thermodesulfovibrio sp.]